MGYLTERERFQIEGYLKIGIKPYRIAKLIGRCCQTVYNEIKRGTIEILNSDLTTRKVYFADVGQRIQNENSHNKGRTLAIGNNIKLADRLEVLIADEKHSPYSALEVCKRENLNVNICRTTLYSYIHKGIFYKLCDKHLPYVKNGKKKQDAEKRVSLNNKNGTSIEVRPKHINKRETYGHWEMDTVCGKQGTTACFFVLTERKSREEIIRKADHKDIENCIRILNELEQEFKDKFGEKFKSITCDNGVEFLAQELMEKSTLNPDAKRTQIYYCHPYRSNERGSNENQNRIIRRFYPKGMDLTNVTPEEVQRVQDHMNNLPRKMFKGKTSLEMAMEWGFV